MAKEKTERIVFDGKIVCPYCGKKAKLKIVKDVLTPGVKAETQLRLITDKDDQTDLKGG